MANCDNPSGLAASALKEQTTPLSNLSIEYVGADRTVGMSYFAHLEQEHSDVHLSSITRFDDILWQAA